MSENVRLWQNAIGPTDRRISTCAFDGGRRGTFARRVSSGRREHGTRPRHCRQMVSAPASRESAAPIMQNEPTALWASSLLPVLTAADYHPMQRERTPAMTLFRTIFVALVFATIADA